ncbi:MAG TPA: GNAT family N-acetyltransferase [Gemmatimonadaceae bacterium]
MTAAPTIPFTAPATPPTIRVRDAEAADNAALVQLAAACPMRGDLTMCIDREPDFFALAQLEGERWRVGVTEHDGEITGCVAASARTSYVDGYVTPTGYVGDLKVHPTHRGGESADALTRFAADMLRTFGGNALLTLVTILEGNRAMERRTIGPRGLPRLTRLATLEVHAIPFLWPRAASVDGIRVESARREDLDEMGELWRGVAQRRQFAPVLDAERLAAFIDAAPGLAIEDYLVARRADGRIAGFVALWDQRLLKQLRVLGYSRRLSVARTALGAVARVAGTSRLPDVGDVLPSLAALHLCVPHTAPEVLRALLLHAYAVHRRSGRLFLTLALDRRDPLHVALRGLFAQPTYVGAYATTPAGRWRGRRLDGLPLHFEAALV